MLIANSGDLKDVVPGNPVMLGLAFNLVRIMYSILSVLSFLYGWSPKNYHSFTKGLEDVAVRRKLGSPLEQSPMVVNRFCASSFSSKHHSLEQVLWMSDYSGRINCIWKCTE